MWYKDVKVEIPSKKRITQSRTGHLVRYVYEILYRKDKEHSKEKTVCVGMAVSDTMMIPNEKYYELHPDNSVKIPEGEEKVFDNQIHIGAVMALRSVAEQTGLMKALSENLNGYEELIQTIAEYYLIRRQSAGQLYKYYLRDHYTTLNKIPSEKILSKFFNVVLGHKEITEFLEKWMSEKLRAYSKDMQVEVDFDSTNYNISSGDVESAEYGHPKVDEELQQINVAYFLDRNTGLPLYYAMYYGSIPDINYCETAINKLRAVNQGVNVTFVLDRGFYSENNLKKIIGKKFSFMCMGKSTTMYYQLIKEYPASEISKARNRVIDNIYGIKIKDRSPFREDKEKYNIYLYYNTTDSFEQIPGIQSILEDEAKRLIGKYDTNGKLSEKYKGKINILTGANNEILNATINYDYVDNVKSSMGYFWIISNEDRSLLEVYESYRHRDAIEKIFRGIKSGVDLNKSYCTSDTAAEAKQFMGFLTSVLHAQMMVNLKPFFTQYSSETIPTVLAELDKIKAESWADQYMLRTPLTNKQKQLLSYFGLTSKNVQKYVNEINQTMNLV